MQNVRTIKKGQYLYQEGDKPTHVYLIQSGKVSLTVERGNQKFSLGVLGNSQLVGVQALFGSKTHGHSALAEINCEVVEMPIAAIRQQFENETQIMKVVLKSLGDQLKTTITNYKSLKLENDNSPCPKNLIAKIFGMIFLITKQHGQKRINEADENTPLTEISWDALKDYGYQMFLEEPERVKSALEICSKVGLCELVVDEAIEKRPHMQFNKICFSEIEKIGSFADFMQTYQRTATVLSVESLYIKMVEGLVKLFDETPEKKFGKKIHFASAAAKFRDELKTHLNPTHIEVLQKRGAKISQNQSANQGVFLEYDRDELEEVLIHWKLLAEVDKWNEKGFVDLSEPVDEALEEQPGAEPGCPECKTEIEGQLNFCPNCGHKLVGSAA